MAIFFNIVSSIIIGVVAYWIIGICYFTNGKHNWKKMKKVTWNTLWKQAGYIKAVPYHARA